MLPNLPFWYFFNSVQFTAICKIHGCAYRGTKPGLLLSPGTHKDSSFNRCKSESRFPTSGGLVKWTHNGKLFQPQNYIIPEVWCGFALSQGGGNNCSHSKHQGAYVVSVALWPIGRLMLSFLPWVCLDHISLLLSQLQLLKLWVLSFLHKQWKAYVH